MAEKTYKKVLELVDKVSKPLDKIINETDKTTRQTKKLVKTYNIFERTCRNMQAGIYKTDRRLRDLNTTIEKAAAKTSNIKKLGNDISGFGQKLTVGVTLPIVGLGAAMIKSAADMEAMQQQLATMLQSEEKGAKMFDDIKKMASKTPMETTDLMQATSTMLSFGIAQEKILPLMRQLGDIAGGNKDRFSSLALAFSQVSSAGKLQGQDLMQMINAGFNPLEAISKRTGKSMAVLKEEMSKGKITINMVEQAMADCTSEGGRFYKMMEKQSQTAVGQWSTFQDNLNQTLAEFGKVILPYAISGLTKITELFTKINSLTPEQKKFVIVIASIVAIIPLLIAGIGGLITSLAGLTVAFNVLSANPVALIIAGIVVAIAAVVAAIYLLWKNWDKIWNGIKNVTMTVVNFIVNLITNIIKVISNFIDKLGVLAYLIPGLNLIKAGKDIAGAIGSIKNTTTNNNNSINNSNNTTTINNYNNTVTPFGSAVYSF